MNARLGALCAITILIASLVACGGGGSSSPTPAPSLMSVSVTGASSVNVGDSVQLAASGHYSDGSSKDLTSSASWSSSSASLATVSSAGSVAAVKGGAVTITATVKGISGSLNLSVVALLNSVDVNPIGPGIVIGDAVQFTATGHYNDGTTADLTAASAWSSSDATKASVAAGLASGVAKGAVMITVTALSANGASITNSSALNVVPVPAVMPNLSGNYAFTITSADTRGPQFFAGSFNADGHGGLAGVEDSNTALGVLQNVPVTGTYSVYPDGRGTIVFNANAIYPTGVTFRFILAAGGTIGKLIQFDGKATSKGSFEPQDASAFQNASLSGTYVFRTTGIDSATQPVGQVGEFVADGAGNVSGGTLDQDDYGVVTTLVPMVPSAYSIDASGRGTLQLATATGAANFVAYVVSANKVNLIQVDAAPSLVLAGVAELQASQAFTPSSLMTGFAFQLERPALIRTNGFDRREFAQIGAYSFDGIASVTGARDDANNGTLNPLDGITGAYSVGMAGVSGRGTLTAISALGNRSYVFYMVGPDRMFVLQTYNGSTTGSLNAPVGVAQQQVDRPYSIGSLNGTFAVDLSDLTATYTEVLMQMVFDGTGNLYGIADLSRAGVLNSVVLNATDSVSASDSTFGRGVVVLPSPLGANNYAFYTISSRQAWLLGITPNAEGSINLQ